MLEGRRAQSPAVWPSVPLDADFYAASLPLFQHLSSNGIGICNLLCVPTDFL
ncbi:unnamed protein product [Periconia digitata]|uniref:Uncharacterized protein n=1 Tax=Periconia digitata TaxID=1303443 RepID=A0A9W4XII4_9PLEO|nr:unnamed protein product [Periconia digitata]